MFCYTCGAQIEDGSSVCPVCGQNLKSAEIGGQAAPMQQAPTQNIYGGQQQAPTQNIYGGQQQAPNQNTYGGQPQTPPYNTYPSQQQTGPYNSNPGQPQTPPYNNAPYNQSRPLYNGPQGYYQQEQKMNPLAIAGFVLALVGLLLLNLFGIVGIAGMILSIIGLTQINGGKGKGRGFAIAGIVIGLLDVIVAAIIVFAAVYGYNIAF